ncbi:MAG: FAD-dependent oxidoreductase, partial [Actinobacteria bacterium]|nr:FAD-dependent oxidoreductase [Actinomycetota bacterium]
MSTSTFAIVGASLAGLSAASTLRARGDDDAIVVVDPSPQLPADHPPLSKQVLSGEWEPARAVQPLSDRLPELDLDLRLGIAATALDVTSRTLRLSDGSTLRADGIILAMGAAARRLHGPPLGGVHVLRDLADAVALRGELVDGPRRVGVIGAGFV